MNTSSYAQYGMYAFLATLTLGATYLKIIPVETGIPIFSGLVGTVVGWHIPSPGVPVAQVNTPQAVMNTDKTNITEAPR
jgi:hypothetical protein